MKIQKWVHFIPQQFVAVHKDTCCITFQCTNEEANKATEYIENEMVGKVWVVDCKTAGSTAWMQAPNGFCVYSLSFEVIDDYLKFLKAFDDLHK